jgi:hypothetical protein
MIHTMDSASEFASERDVGVYGRMMMRCVSAFASPSMKKRTAAIHRENLLTVVGSLGPSSISEMPCPSKMSKRKMMGVTRMAPTAPFLWYCVMRVLYLQVAQAHASTSDIVVSFSVNAARIEVLSGHINRELYAWARACLHDGLELSPWGGLECLLPDLYLDRSPIFG